MHELATGIPIVFSVFFFLSFLDRHPSEVYSRTHQPYCPAVGSILCKLIIVTIVSFNNAPGKTAAAGRIWV